MEPMPPGCGGLVLTRQQADKYELMTGPTSLDVVEYAVLPRATVLGDVQQYGALSPFNAFQKQLEKLDSEDVFIASDIDERYCEDGWILCFTAQGRAAMEEWKLPAVAEDGQEGKEEDGDEAVGLEVGADEQGEEEEEDLSEDESILVVEQPIAAKPYRSMTAAVTEEEVARAAALSTRPRIRVRVSRRRGYFGGRCALNNRDVDPGRGSSAVFRVRVNQKFHTRRLEQSVGLQAGPSALSGKADKAVQTRWFRPVNTAVQCTGTVDDEVVLASTQGDGNTDVALNSANAVAAAAERADAASQAAGRPTGLGFGLGGLPGSAQPGEKAAKSQTGADVLASFLRKTIKATEECLSQNETLDVLREGLGAGDSGGAALVSGKGESAFQEVLSVMDLDYTTRDGMRIVATDWHPQATAVVAVAPNLPLNFEERVELSGHSATHHCLVFTTRQFSGAALVLECPHEATVVKWHPTKPHILAAGCNSGQVVLWDLQGRMGNVFSRGNRRGDRQKAKRPGDSGKSGVVVVPPLSVTHIDHSHARPVTDLHWLPHPAHLSARKDQVGAMEADGSHQILSASSDGSLCVWDTLYKQRAAAQRQRAAETGNVASSGAGQQDQDEAQPSAQAHNALPWLPLHRCGVLSGATPVPLQRVLLHKENPTDPLLCLAEDGSLLAVDWLPAPLGTGLKVWTGPEPGTEEGDAAAAAAAAAGPGRNEREAGGEDGGSGGAGSGEATNTVVWMQQDHTRPGRALAANPRVSTLYLSVGEWGFSLWRRGLRSPLFTSPPSATPITTGCWSPLRAAVVLLGKEDGSVEIWDLSDTTLRPALEPAERVVSTRVESLSFQRTARHRPALLSVGDGKGNLHVFEPPAPVRRASQHEDALLTRWVERETRRVHHARQRAEAREQEGQAVRQAEEEAKAKEEAAASTLQSELQALSMALGDEAEATVELLQARKEAEKRQKEEQGYTAMERELLESLGLVHAEGEGAASVEETKE